MSGGAFDYKQHHIEEIAGEIEQEIIQAGRESPQEIWAKNHWYASSFDDSDRTYPTYERKTIDIMKRAVYVLRMAYIYAKRIDWMLSGDDSEESLAKRLDEELRSLKAKYPGGKFTFKEKDVYFDKECERYMLKDNLEATLI